MKTFRTSLICVAVAALAFCGFTQSFADSAPSLGQAGQYAFFDWGGQVQFLGVGVTGNYAQVTGLMTLDGNSYVTGKAYLSSGVGLIQVVNGSHIDGGIVQPFDLTQATADAIAASAAAAALPATQTFGTIASAQTITGNGGLNVIKIGQLAASLTLTGSVSDTFVVDITGAGLTLVSGAGIALKGGVTPDHVLVNVTGGQFTVNGGGVLNGTYLTTKVISIDHCQLINGALMGSSTTDIKYTTINNVPFIPEPSSVSLVLCALAGFAAFCRRAAKGRGTL